MQKFSLITFLTVLGVTIVACGVGARLLVQHMVAHDAILMGDLANLVLTRSLPASSFTPTAPSDRPGYAKAIKDIAASEDVIRVVLYDAEARVLWSDDPGLIGQRFTHNRELREALHGHIEAEIIRPGKEEHQGTLRSFERIEEIYLPIRYVKDGPIVGVLEIYRCPPALFAVVDRGRALVWLLGGSGGFVLYATLFGMARLGVVEVGPAAPILVAEEALRAAVERSVERRRTETALRRMNETLEAETKRIAHEVHDEAGQLIATARFALADVARGMTAPERDALREVSRVLDEIAEQLRRLAHELRPTILDDLGLVPALRFLAEGVARRTTLDISVEASVDDRPPAMVETALYRIVQEAITNVVKHAHARRVVITVGRDPGGIRCSIRDDGVGFDAVALSRQRGARGLGLLGITNRIEALGGRLDIVSTPGQGATLTVHIPLS